MNDIKYICTYFDFNFLPRGLALYYSIKKQHSNFLFYVLCFDEQTYDYLSKLNEPPLRLISINEYNSYFQTSKKKFADIKQYYFSATPNLCIYLLQANPNIEVLLYLDADVYIFHSLDPIYEEFSDASIGFCSHRFSRLFKITANNYGKYNVGVNLFKNDRIGSECLLDWKNNCDSWYPNKPGYPLTFFSDQIFLDSWPAIYEKVKIIRNKGVNVAPWNASNYKFKKINDTYFVDNEPLIIYHFSSLKKHNNNKWNANTICYFASIKHVLLEIYKEYILEIESFGLRNQKSEILTHRIKTIKKIVNIILNNFLNENIIIKRR